MTADDARAAMEQRFISDVLRNRFVRSIFERWSDLALPQGWLVAGCLFQSAWNAACDRPAEENIKDYDLFYFDAADLGAQAEQRVQSRVAAVLADLGVEVEAKNQARVHLWYPEHFGRPYPQLASVQEGVDRFLVPATCVALRPAGGSWELYAPHGLAPLYEGVLSPNPLTDHRDLFLEKARSYRRRWDWLRLAVTPP
jgi:hypothetical protein